MIDENSAPAILRRSRYCHDEPENNGHCRYSYYEEALGIMAYSTLNDSMLNLIQARIQLLAKGEVVKIMENNVLLPQAANVSDRIPRKLVPQPARMSFSGYTIDSQCTSWEPIGGICKPGSWGGAPGSNHILSNI